MHSDLFDRYKVGDSPLHHLNPQVKVVVVVLFVLSNVVLPDGAWVGFALSWLLLLAASQLSGLGIGFALKRSFIALPFVLAAFSSVFAIPGEPVFTWQMGHWSLTATDAGVLRFVSVVLRAWLSVQGAILLVATTSFPDLMHALRHLYVPAPLVSVISFMYRYLFVLADETIRLLRARDSRSARMVGRPSGGSLGWRARVAGNMAGQLFLRSYERSERVYDAMLARGYRGKLLTINPHTMDRVDWAAAVIVVVGLFVIQISARILFL